MTPATMTRSASSCHAAGATRPRRMLAAASAAPAYRSAPARARVPGGSAHPRPGTARRPLRAGSLATGGCDSEDVADGELHPGREQDEAEDHHVVVECESGECEVRALPGRRARHASPGALVVAGEIAPPERSDDPDAEHRSHEDREVERVAARADADRDDGLAERDDHQQAVPLDEMRCADVEADRTAGERRRDHAPRSRARRGSSRPDP